MGLPDDAIREVTALVAYALASVFGALGGCAAASNAIFNGKELRMSFLFSYIVAGMSSAILLIAYTNVFLGAHLTIDQIILHTFVTAIIGSTLLAGGHITARLVLKKLGITVTITARHDKDERRRKNDGQE